VNKLWLFAIPLGLIAAVWAFSGPILRGIGSLFENDGPPVSADIILVLAGDSNGNRILKGAELARQGFAPVVLASNGEAEYGRTESQLATEFAIQRGYSPGLFIVANWLAHSTVEEAHLAIATMRSRGVHKAIIVTTSWHTARAGRIYRRNAPDLTFYMVGAIDPGWHNGDWWIDREGRKTFFLEGVKTIADFLGI
jgi:uncharacterized SAM-binding protein YcdF (DUF218 family)